jgi:predicted MPP superfamily phosphohydrolase
MRLGKLKLFSLGLFLAIAGVVVWAFFIEPGRLVTREVRLEIPHWDGDLRIAVVSDIHTGSPHNGVDKLQRLVATINAQNPAMIVFPGDFVTGGPRGGERPRFVEPERIAQELKKLHAPLGIYAVLGNHDWWFDGNRVARALTSAGVRVLENEAVKIPAPQPFWLGGIADLWTRNPDIPATLAQVTDDAPVVLFTHNPDVFREMPSRVSLMLAAHTHGGQVQLPILGTVITTSQFGYNAGLFVEDGRHLYVTTGIGTSILGVRFRVPPELVMMTLASESASAR